MRSAAIYSDAVAASVIDVFEYGRRRFFELVCSTVNMGRIALQHRDLHIKPVHQLNASMGPSAENRAPSCAAACVEVHAADFGGSWWHL